jgi:FkbM family methyltransferase
VFTKIIKAFIRRDSLWLQRGSENMRYQILKFRLVFSKYKDFDLNDEHKVISRFTGLKEVQERGCKKDFLGTIELVEYLPDSTILPNVGTKIPVTVAVDEEYFEWISLLSAVISANDNFTFIELGAGYGRWSARAFKAGIRVGISPEKIRLITVEAEPKHSEWCLKHLQMNGVPEGSHIHFQNAISNYKGDADFFVKNPLLTRSESEKNWYGQALATSSWAGAETERVVTITLNEVFAKVPEGVIDLIDSDLQGEDFKVFSHNPTLLDRVKRVHIGTDSRLEEIQFQKFFLSLGWQNQYNFAGRDIRNTHAGKISFVDGVQSWLNPKYFSS